MSIDEDLTEMSSSITSTIETSEEESSSSSSLVEGGGRGGPPSEEAEKISYLPSWVLDFRRKITSSREQHALAEKSLSGLSSSLAVLEDDLRKISLIKGASSPSSSTAASSTGDNITNAFTSTTTSNKNNDHVHHVQPRRLRFDDFPDDVVSSILFFLDINVIGILECVSNSFKAAIGRAPAYWIERLPECCPHEQSTANWRRQEIRRIRNAVMMSMNMSHRSLSFVEEMKDQRCVKRQPSIQPHRHYRNERTVTHPLPIFQSSASARGMTAIGSPTQARGARSSFISDMIMSRAETLNADTRTHAQRALEAMYEVTRSATDPLHGRLVEAGAVTVLVSLLSNESGAITNLSAGVIANLLVWESRRRSRRRAKRLRDRRRTRSHVGRTAAGESVVGVAGDVGRENDLDLGDDGGTVSASEGSHRFVVGEVLNEIEGEYADADADTDADTDTDAKTDGSEEEVVPLSEQLRACDGQRLLVGLLTSPTASINLGSMASRDPRRTASVQGMSSKEASRALVTLFGDRHPVPAPPRTPSLSTPTDHPEPPGNNRVFSSTLPSISSSPTRPSHPILEAAAHCSPPSAPSSSTAKAKLAKGLLPTAFLDEPAARAWLFSYYHKSGNLKDQCIAYLFFTLDGCVRGRGLDSIGLFTLSGRADADITSHVWYFHKTYVGQDVAFAVGEQLPAISPTPAAAAAAAAAAVTGSAPVAVTTAVAGGGAIEGGAAVRASGTAPSAASIRGPEPWIQRWLELAHLEPQGAGRAGLARSQHVSHSGHWCPGVRHAKAKHSHNADRVSWSSRGGTGKGGLASGNGGGHVREQMGDHQADVADIVRNAWGLGLYGVWETSGCKGSHFSLEKGGVWVATPVP